MTSRASRRLRDRVGRPAWLGGVLLGLAALAAVILMGLASPAQSFIVLDQRDVPEGCAAKPAAITLDGQPVLEVRSNAGAESITAVAERSSRTLLELAQNLAISPAEIAVDHQGTESFILLRQKGEPERRLGVVNQRIARCYGMEPQRLAELSRDQIRAAMVRYRKAHSLQAWLQGSGLAALVLAVYVLWLRLQFRLNGRLRDLIANREHFLLQQLARFGLTALVEPAQVRRCL